MGIRKRLSHAVDAVGDAAGDAVDWAGDLASRDPVAYAALNSIKQQYKLLFDPAGSYIPQSQKDTLSSAYHAVMPDPIERVLNPYAKELWSHYDSPGDIMAQGLGRYFAKIAARPFGEPTVDTLNEAIRDLGKYGELQAKRGVRSVKRFIGDVKDDFRDDDDDSDDPDDPGTWADRGAFDEMKEAYRERWSTMSKEEKKRLRGMVDVAKNRWDRRSWEDSDVGEWVGWAQRQGDNIADRTPIWAANYLAIPAMNAYNYLSNNWKQNHAQEGWVPDEVEIQMPFTGVGPEASGRVEKQDPHHWWEFWE